MLKRYLILTMSLLLTQTVFTQSNYDFEGNGSGSIEGWDHTCAAPTLVNEGSNSSNEWSMKVQGGNTQGCISSYVYAPISNVENVISISAMAMSLDGPAELSLGKLTIDNQIVLINTDTTSTTTWTELSIGGVDSLVLETGEKALIVLSAGMTAGPAPEEFALFDYVATSGLTNNSNIKNVLSITLSPNPAQDFLTVQLPEGISSPNIAVYNLLGKQVFCHSSIMETGVVSLTVSDLQEGIYLLQLMDDQRRRVTKKFIVAR